MFSPKCANTSCGEEFDFRRGRLFRIDLPHANAYSESSHLNAAHFWLCDRCSVKYTVEFTEGSPTVVKSGSPDPASPKARRKFSGAKAA